MKHLWSSLQQFALATGSSWFSHELFVQSKLQQNSKAKM